MRAGELQLSAFLSHDPHHRVIKFFHHPPTRTQEKKKRRRRRRRGDSAKGEMLYQSTRHSYAHALD